MTITMRQLRMLVSHHVHTHHNPSYPGKPTEFSTDVLYLFCMAINRPNWDLWSLCSTFIHSVIRLHMVKTHHYIIFFVRPQHYKRVIVDIVKIIIMVGLNVL